MPFQRRACDACGADFQKRTATQRFCERCIYVLAPCEGCGTEVRRTRAEAERHPIRFCSNHCANSRSRKGGVFFSGGRWYVKCRDGRQMPYYRAVMAGHIGRLLTKDEHVHHLNEDRADDRIENLLLTTASEHIRLHQEALQAGRGR